VDQIGVLVRRSYQGGPKKHSATIAAEARRRIRGPVETKNAQQRASSHVNIIGKARSHVLCASGLRVPALVGTSTSRLSMF
jgi:hypothetical protein